MIRMNPYDPVAHSKLAVWYFRRWQNLGHDPNNAIRTLERGLEYCPGSFELHYLLAGMYRQIGEPQKARRAYAEALKLRPRSWRTLEQLARLAEVSGDYTEARYYDLLAAQIKPGGSADQAEDEPAVLPDLQSVDTPSGAETPTSAPIPTLQIPPEAKS
jgi:tetratricopeptide (TPR) repeat protein